jgi:hypothetical protein
VTGSSGPTGAQGPTGSTGPTSAPPTQINSLSVNSTTAPTGQIWATGSITSYFSDMRLKNILNDIENSLEKVLSLNGVYYNKNDLARSYGYEGYEQEVGLIAQEVEEVLPEVIRPAPFDVGVDGSISGENYITVMYDKVVPLLIEALKEQKRQIDYLNTKV